MAVSQLVAQKARQDFQKRRVSARVRL
jgi:hypothetical protein